MSWTVTDDIYRETWNRLYEFSNVELTYDRLVELHGVPKKKSEKNNYKKQAEQARVCCLQAKEYFDVAKSSSLYTSPNHVYYGSVALTSMMMLVLGNGDCALDVLRKNSGNKHHGMEFTTASNASSAKASISLLENSFVKILSRGHFANWYRVLPRIGEMHALHTQDVPGGCLRSHQVVGRYKVNDYEYLDGKKYCSLDLAKRLPDLVTPLLRYNVPVIGFRTSHQVEQSEEKIITHTWYIHDSLESSQRSSLLKEFAFGANLVPEVKYSDESMDHGGKLSVSYMEGEECKFLWPHCRETLFHNQYSFYGDMHTHEIVDLFMLAYQFSMLSRYFPDLWVGCIESQCKGAQIINKINEIIQTKLPIIALSMLSNERVVVSTQPAPWDVA